MNTKGKVFISIYWGDMAAEQVAERLKAVGFDPVVYPYKSRDDEEMIALAADCDYVVEGGARLSRRYFEAMRGKLKLHVHCSVGYDQIDVEAAAENGIVFTNMPGVNADAVAEHTVSLILAMTHGLIQRNQDIRTGYWNRVGMYRSLSDLTVGLVGFGHIGRRLAAFLRPFGCEILAFDMKPDLSAGAELGVQFVELDELKARSNILSLHVPLNRHTFHMADKSFISGMKDGAILINTCRGAVVNEEDIIEALHTGKLSGYAADVFEQEPLPVDSPMRALDNVLFTPHSASDTEGVRRNVIDTAVRMVTSFENNGD